MATPELDTIYQLVNTLDEKDKRELMRHLTASFMKQSVDDDEWSEGEIEALLADYQPMSGPDIVAGGFTGGWEHRDDISDGGEWVRQKRTADKTIWQ